MNGLSQAKSSAAPVSVLDRMAVLSDPVRCRLLLLCEQQELSVSEIRAILQLPQSTVSRHLKTLVEDGWLQARKDGTNRRYSARGDRPETAAELWSLVRKEIAPSARAAEDQRRMLSVLAERHSRSQEFFSTSAGRWAEMRRELFGARFDLEAALAFLDDRWTVGELGCGTGDLAAALAPHVERVLAIDESPEMLTAASQRLEGADNVEVRAGHLEALPIEDGELDAATIVLVLHHVTSPEEVIREAARCLRPGGQLLIVDMLPHEREAFRAEMGHVWLGFDEATMRAWLEGAGLVRRRIRTLSPQSDVEGPSLFAASASKPVAEAIELPQPNRTATAG